MVTCYVTEQLFEAIGLMGNAKDLVALSLAHECDELKLKLEPFRALAQDSFSPSSLGPLPFYSIT